MVHRRRVDGLRDDNDADDKSEQRREEHGDTGARGEHPVDARHAAEVGGRDDVDVADVREQRLPHRVEARRSIDLDQDENRLVLGDRRVVLRVLERGEDVGRRRERANPAGESGDARPPSANLEHVADLRDAELVLVQLVDEHAVGKLQIGDASFDHVPRRAERLIGVEPDHLDAFLASVAALPLREADDVLGCVRDAGRRQHGRELALGERDAHLDVRHARRRHPEIRPRVIDQTGRRGREPEEQPELHDDQHHREHDARHGDEQADSVVHQVAPRQLGDSEPHRHCHLHRLMT